MVARENHVLFDNPFLAALAVVHLLIDLFDKHEMPENVEKAVALENLLPEISCPVTGRMLGVTHAALDFTRVAAAIEGQKVGRVVA